MQYVFEILISHDRFELLLQRRTDSDEESLTGFRVALHSYLQAYHPNEEDKLQMMFFRFQMYREIGESIEKKAGLHLAELKGKSPSAALTPQVLEIMQNYLDSADYYYKDKCFNSSSKCFAWAALCGLQAKIPDVRMINLSLVEVSEFLTYNGSFEDSLILATAYGKSAFENWIGPMYHQVIFCNNFAFLEDYLSHFSPNNELFAEMEHRFQADPEKSYHGVTFRKFLSYLDDQYFKLEIAQRLRFHDLVKDIEENTPGIIFFKEAPQQ